MFGLALVGLGPAGTGVLSAAQHSGRLPAMLSEGLLVLEQRSEHSAGALGEYHVSSDTTAAVFAEVLEPLVATHPATGGAAAVRSVMAIGTSGPVDVRVAGEALREGTRPLVDLVRRSPGGDVRFGARVSAVRRLDHCVEIETTTAAGRRDVVRARRVILAVGGEPHIPDELTRVLARRSRPRLVHSDAVLRMTPRELSALLRQAPPGRTTVVGSSHSAFAVVRRLLAAPRDSRSGPPSITIAHRAPLRTTYDDVDAARADGATFTDADICPLTRRVFRFSGLRWHAAALLREIRRGEHPGVSLVSIADAASAAEVASSGGLVIAATGYRSAAAGLLADGEFDGRVRAVGLCTHRRAREDGGESSFDGYVDGVWFYHRVLAPRVLDDTYSDHRPAAVPAGRSAGA